MEHPEDIYDESEPHGIQIWYIGPKSGVRPAESILKSLRIEKKEINNYIVVFKCGVIRYYYITDLDGQILYSLPIVGESGIYLPELNIIYLTENYYIIKDSNNFKYYTVDNDSYSPGQIKYCIKSKAEVHDYIADKIQLILQPEGVRLGDFRSNLGMCHTPRLDKSAPHDTKNIDFPIIIIPELAMIIAKYYLATYESDF